MVGLPLILVVAPAMVAGNPAANEFFESQVRPLLVNRCLTCHGSEDIQGGLRLTSRESLLSGGETGPAAIAGKPNQSLLLKAVLRDGIEMPPDEKLSGEEVEVLRQWIEMGIPWPDEPAPHVATADEDANAAIAWQKRLEEGREHWSLKPVQKPPVPAVQNAGWPLGDLDRFVLAQLEAKQLTPSPRAERTALLRRVTFDLIGLPPTPEEVANFVADNSSEAFAKVVDRLLSSPRYGERWARHWLDVARYSDTKGHVLFEGANYPWAYTYRDYVIRSFNEDLPYDQFILQQLAADCLPLGDDKRPLTALGYLTVGTRFLNEHDRLDDRIDVITRGLQGLTVSCARCHDHKYDPISARDYYSLYGIMASSVEPMIFPLFEQPPNTAEYSAFLAGLAEREKKLAEFVDKKYADVETSARTRVAEYLLAANAQRAKPVIDNFLVFADGNEVNPKIAIRWRAYLERSRRTGEPVFALWHALADLPAEEFAELASPVIAKFAAPERGGAVNSIVLAAILAQPPSSLADVAARYADVLLTVDASNDGAKQAEGPELLLGEASQREALRLVLHGVDSPVRLQRTPGGDPVYLQTRGDLEYREKLLGEIETWCATAPGAPPRAMVLNDRDTPYQPRVFGRGNPSNLREAVPRQFLQVLSPTDAKPYTNGSGRLELAQAIANPNNPLTARVLVNRVWQHHFGAGLVRTPSDFGNRGEAPTHPELLDYLAATFVEEGWSIKKLHRRILLSATYQQASADRPECAAIDPENRLLWKFPRLRLEFEALRDALLFVADRLAPALYGPSSEELANPQATRRTIYCKIDRLDLPGVLRTFDFPNPDSSNSQRDLTTVPQQSLFLLNNPFLEAQARHLIERKDVVAISKVEARIDRLYQLLFSRSPSQDEQAIAQEYLGASPDHTHWLRYAQSLMMLNEFAVLD
jgi:hypothetical protein